MALIVCADCQREISDAALACIHCGRPRSGPEIPAAPSGAPPAAETGFSFGWTGGRALDDARARLRSGWRGLRELADDSRENTRDWLREQSERLGERAQEMSERAVGMVLTDCAVPTLLLPTGPAPADFVCVFRFGAVLEQLQRGTLVRPRVVAWAGHPNIDRDRLAAVLRDEFALQFREQRDTVLPASAEQRTRLAALEQSASRSGSRTKTAAQAAATGVVAMLLFANPLADLAFLALAIFGGTSAVQGLWRTLRRSADVRRETADLQRRRQQLERDLDRGNERFQSAVRRIEVRGHPILRDLVAQMAEIEDQPLEGLVQALPPDPAAPDPRPFLREDAYRRRVPTWFHPLIDLHLAPIAGDLPSVSD
jgi:hypothetical protein